MTKTHVLKILILGLILVTSCTPSAKSQITDVAVWKLGWRMIGNSMDKNYAMANLQFDSIINLSGNIDKKISWQRCHARGIYNDTAF